MQLDTSSVENAPTNTANPVSPGSPFSAKQRKWSGIVQQVQDSSARLDLRRRQSTEAAASATPLLHMPPSSTAHRTVGSALQPMRSQFAATTGALVRRAATEAENGSVLQAGVRRCSNSSGSCPLENPGARDKVPLRSPQRFTSLKQRLREVKRARHHKNSSRASSVLTDNTDDSSVVSEGSSVVEAKLEQLLLQVSGDPNAANASARVIQRQQQSYPKADSVGNFNSSRGDRLNAGGLLGQGSGSKQQQPACAAQKGLGVTVRRFKPPTSSLTMAPLPAGGIPFSSSSPSLTTAATAAAPTTAAAAAAAAACSGPSAATLTASHVGTPASLAAQGSMVAVPAQEAACAAAAPVVCDTSERQHSASTHSSGSSANCSHCSHCSHSSRQCRVDVNATCNTAGQSFSGSMIQPMQQPGLGQQVLQAQPYQQAMSAPPCAAPIMFDGANRSTSDTLNGCVATVPLPPAVAGGALNSGAGCCSSRRPLLLLTPPDAAVSNLGMPLPAPSWAGDSPSSTALCAAGSSIVGPSSYSMQRNSGNTPTTLAATAAGLGPAGLTEAQQADSGCNVPSVPSNAATAVDATRSAEAVPNSAATGTQAVPSSTAVAGQGARAQHSTAQLLAGRSVLQCSYSGMADVFNDADIQHLLRKVAACVGPECGHASATAGTAQAAAGGSLSAPHAGASLSAAGRVLPSVKAAGNASNHSMSAHEDRHARDMRAHEHAAAPTAAGAATAVVPAVSSPDPASPGPGSCPTRRQFTRHVSWKAEVDVRDLDADSEHWRPTSEQAAAAAAAAGAAGATAAAAAGVPARPAAWEAARPAEPAVLSPGDTAKPPGSAVAASSGALVVRLSSAALALAAGLEKQQQRLEEARELREASLSGCLSCPQGHGQPHSSSQPAAGRLSARPAAGPVLASGLHNKGRTGADGFGVKAGFRVQQAESIAGTADDVSSCCGSSELSAMANPVAYADRLTQRMAQHLGSAGNSPGSSRGMGAAAAGGQSERVFESGSSSTAVNLLERYLNGHQGLKQKAVRLEQNLKQRNQMRSDREQQVLVQQSVAQLQHAFSPLGQPSQWQSTASPSPLHAPARHALPSGQMSSATNVQLQEHSRKPLGVKAGLISSSQVDPECQLNVDKLKQDLELVLRRV